MNFRFRRHRGEESNNQDYVSSTLLELARLNLDAARLSILKSAFYPASHFLRSGQQQLAILSEMQRSSEAATTFSTTTQTPCRSEVAANRSTSDRLRYSWIKHYDLCLDMHVELIETCYVIGKHDEARDAIKQVLSNARNLVDKFRAQSSLLEIAVNGKDRDEGRGAKMCIEFLQLYGYDIPYKPSRLAVFLEKKRLKKLLAPTGSLDAILRAPIASKTEAISASVFLGKLSVFAFLSGNFTLATLSSLYHIKHARDYGVTIHTALSLAMIAITEGQRGNNAECFRYADLPFRLMNRLYSWNGCSSNETTALPSVNRSTYSNCIIQEKNRNHSLCSQILVVVHAGIMELRKPLQESLDPFMRAYRHGIIAGDFEHAFCGAMNYGYIYHFVGKRNCILLQSSLKYFVFNARVRLLRLTQCYYCAYIIRASTKPFGIRHDLFWRRILSTWSCSDYPGPVHNPATNSIEAYGEGRRP